MFISLGMFLLFLVVNNIGTAVTVTRLLLLETGKYLNIIYLVFVLKYQFSNHHRTVQCPGTLRTQLISEIESFRRPKIIINRKNAQNGKFLKLQFCNEAWLDMEQWGAVRIWGYDQGRVGAVAASVWLVLPLSFLPVFYLCLVCARCLLSPLALYHNLVDRTSPACDEVAGGN